MNHAMDERRPPWWRAHLEDIDRQLARLTMLCRVRILDPGIITRILLGDESVCEAANSAGFWKLRSFLRLHLIVRDLSAGERGPLRTAASERFIVERLRRRLPDLGLNWPAA
jgi:hypothetical protein